MYCQVNALKYMEIKMSDELTPHAGEWEGDIFRDMVTFRFIELSMSVLELIFNDSEENMVALKEEYLEWIEKEAVTDVQADKTVEICEFTPMNETSIKLVALNRKYEFFTSFKTPVFETSILFSYDFERMDVVGARVVSFKGDMNIAINWAEMFLDRVDKILEYSSDEE